MCQITPLECGKNKNNIVGSKLKYIYFYSSKQVRYYN